MEKSELFLRLALSKEWIQEVCQKLAWSWNHHAQVENIKCHDIQLNLSDISAVSRPHCNEHPTYATSLQEKPQGRASFPGWRGFYCEVTGGM